MKTGWVIVGAGACGLAAARAVASGGESVVLLEARDRAGGRIYTLSDPRSSVPLELGAEFIHGEPQETFSLLQEIGTTRCDTAGTRREMRNGEIVDDPEDFDVDLQRLLQRVDDLSTDVSVDEFLRRFASEPQYSGAAGWMRAMVEGFDASDPAKASVRAIAQEWRSEAGIEGASSRPLGGYGPLIDHMLRRLENAGVQTLFGSVVRAISWRRDGVVISGTREGEAFDVEARAAIVTLPLGVLQSNEVTFDPPLPPERVEAIDALAMGPVFKAVMVCSEPFWERIYRGRLHDVGFFHDDDAPFSTIWTSLPLRSSTLVAWAGGPLAERLMRKPADEIYDCVFASLERMLGRGTRDAVKTVYLHDWQADPFARGAYSYVKTGGMGAREVLGAPLNDVLFFAGEATALGGEAGTVAGALRSGIRAARELREAPN